MSPGIINGCAQFLAQYSIERLAKCSKKLYLHDRSIFNQKRTILKVARGYNSFESWCQTKTWRHACNETKRLLQSVFNLIFDLNLTKQLKIISGIRRRVWRVSFGDSRPVLEEVQVQLLRLHPVVGEAVPEFHHLRSAPHVQRHLPSHAAFGFTGVYCFYLEKFIDWKCVEVCSRNPQDR